MIKTFERIGWKYHKPYEFLHPNQNVIVENEIQNNILVRWVQGVETCTKLDV